MCPRFSEHFQSNKFRHRLLFACQELLVDRPDPREVDGILSSFETKDTGVEAALDHLARWSLLRPGRPVRRTEPPNRSKKADVPWRLLRPIGPSPKVPPEVTPSSKAKGERIVLVLNAHDLVANTAPFFGSPPFQTQRFFCFHRKKRQRKHIRAARLRCSASAQPALCSSGARQVSRIATTRLRRVKLLLKTWRERRATPVQRASKSFAWYLERCDDLTGANVNLFGGVLRCDDFM